MPPSRTRRNRRRAQKSQKCTLGPANLDTWLHHLKAACFAHHPDIWTSIDPALPTSPPHPISPAHQHPHPSSLILPALPTISPFIPRAPKPAHLSHLEATEMHDIINFISIYHPISEKEYERWIEKKKMMAKVAKWVFETVNEEEVKFLKWIYARHGPDGRGLREVVGFCVRRYGGLRNSCGEQGMVLLDLEADRNGTCREVEKVVSRESEKKKRKVKKKKRKVKGARPLGERVCKVVLWKNLNIYTT